MTPWKVITPEGLPLEIKNADSPAEAVRKAAEIRSFMGEATYTVFNLRTGKQFTVEAFTKQAIVTSINKVT